MPRSPLLQTDSVGRQLHAILSLQTLSSLDPDRITALEDIGIHTVGQLLHWNPVHYARALMAIADGEVGHDVGLSRLLDAEFADMPRAEIPGALTETVYQIGTHTAEVLERFFGVTTIADLAVFAPFMEAEAYLLPSDLAFQEAQSAPPELIPRVIGAVTSSVRFTTFVREIDLRNVTIHLPQSALSDVPFGHIFISSGTPVIHLGYMAGHIQRWRSHGTHLGEVIHSLPLAPGESRNVTIVDWKRRQLTQRNEDTTLREQIDSVQVHKRALDEVARAVAEEHQYGKTSTESHTGVTSGSFVAAGAVAGGVAGGVVGAIGGGVSGFALSSVVAALDAGAATVGGTIAGGAVGAFAGGAAGAAAGGLIFSGATALGLIESSSEGDREIIARTIQNITQSTVQKSSAIRSLWSTIVIEGVQSEQAEIRTTNVTNYNHMHALTIQYFEVLQHYRTTLSLASVRPLLFLPFRPLNFSFAQIEALWQYLEKTARKELPEGVIDRAFAPLPSEPVAPIPANVGVKPLGQNTAVTQLHVRTIAKYSNGTHTIQLRLNDNQTGYPIPQKANKSSTSSDTRTDEFEEDFPTNIQTAVLAANVAAIRVVVTQLSLFLINGGTLEVELKFTLRDLDDQRTYVLTKWKSLSAKYVSDGSGTKTIDYPWEIAKELGNAQNTNLTQDQVAQQNFALAFAGYEAQVENQRQARQMLEDLFRWRRYAFTQAILQQTEPQQLAEVFEEMTLHVGGGDEVPLHRIVNTVPVGTTGSSFVFELKRNRYDEPDDLVHLMSIARSVTADAERLLGYAHRLLNVFETEWGRFELTESVFLPTSGVFAEAILGRSNSAEKLDITRYFNWQDSPIPNAAPAISAADPNADRNVDQTLVPTVPNNTINLINPVSFPDPTGLSAVLQAVQNGAMFRDMSKSNELTSIIASLSSLAGEMGKASSQMTGNAADQALKSAIDLAKAAAGLAQTMQQPGASQKANPPSSLTEKGATITKLEKLLKEAKAELTKLSNDGGGSSASKPGGATGDAAANADIIKGLMDFVTGLESAQLNALGVDEKQTSAPAPM